MYRKNVASPSHTSCTHTLTRIRMCTHKQHTATRLDGTNDASQGTHTHHIFFANHLPLLPSSSPLVHTTVFRVAIVNPFEATIFILSEPKFLEPPHDVETYQGLPVTIPCSLAKPSSPSPSPSPSPLSEYFTVWRKNGRPLYQSNDVTVTTNGTLVIERSKVSDSGEYDCVAVGEEGVLTATISMAILPRPGLPHPPLHHHHN